MEKAAAPEKCLLSGVQEQFEEIVKQGSNIRGWNAGAMVLTDAPTRTLSRPRMTPFKPFVEA